MTSQQSAERLILWHRLVRLSDENGAEPATVAEWVRTMRSRITAAGGELLAQVSGTVVAEFDASESADVVDTARILVRQAEAMGLLASIGIALGIVEHGIGTPIETAQLLASRAQPGEIVLDTSASERLAGQFLFGRPVSTGVGGPRGTALDQNRPQRTTSAQGIARLNAPTVAPVTSELMPALRAIMREQLSPVVVLRGPAGAGALELMQAAAELAKPILLLGIGSAPGGMVPLGSLRHGLARGLGSEDSIARTCGIDDAGRDAFALLRSMLHGGLPPRDHLAQALLTLFRRIAAAYDGEGSDSRSRIWISLAPLGMVDAATLEVLLAARDLGASVALLARYPVEARLPGAISPPVYELTLPPLRDTDAQFVAREVLGRETDPEIVEVVAALGGDTPLGVLEAARSLLSSADLILDHERYTWRRTPRSASEAISLDDMVTERLDRLDDESKRLLEAICVAPEGCERAMIDAIAARDGMAEKARSRAMARLYAEGWVSQRVGWPNTAFLERDQRTANERPHPSSGFLRRLVGQVMPPARYGELHRFASEALIQGGADDPETPALAAELGWYEIEGGMESQGAARLAEVGRLAADRGYRRAAGRIASLLARVGVIDANRLAQIGRPPPVLEAAPLDPAALDPAALEPASIDARGDATAEIVFENDTSTGNVESPEPKWSSRRTDPSELRSPLPHPPPTERRVDIADDSVDETNPVARPLRTSEQELDRVSFVHLAQDAVRRRDHEALDRLLKRAVAAGGDMAAISRFRALAELLRGDVLGARRALSKARAYHPSRTNPREALAEAIVALAAGDMHEAVRAGLKALALARRAADPLGEEAALRTLAACYRGLGREHDVERLEGIIRSFGEIDAALSL